MCNLWIVWLTNVTAITIVVITWVPEFVGTMILLAYFATCLTASVLGTASSRTPATGTASSTTAATATISPTTPAMAAVSPMLSALWSRSAAAPSRTCLSCLHNYALFGSYKTERIIMGIAYEDTGSALGLQCFEIMVIFKLQLQNFSLYCCIPWQLIMFR